MKPTLVGCKRDCEEGAVDWNELKSANAGWLGGVVGGTLGLGCKGAEEKLPKSPRMLPFPAANGALSNKKE